MATSITLTTNSASTEYTLATGGRGPAGATGPAGAAGTSLTAGTGIDITEGVVSSTVTGNATHTGDATGSTALTLATVNGNIGSFTNASITVNAKGLVTAASNGTAPITTITGTANQITVSSFANARTLSLPATITGLTSVTSTTFVGALTGNATTSSSTTGNAATVTTNANLTGPVTSTGNATAIANGAISNAMLANGAVTNLSGTNTGDETAARIATALNAGTEDSTATDNDKLAVTHPAGGWMLLSALWTWIEAKINALATITGAKSFTGQIASSGSTDATVSTNVVNVATNDARYGGVVTRATALADVTALTTANVSGPAATLAAGTYEYDICQVYETISEVMGVSGGVTLSGNLDTMHSGVLTKATSVTGNGSSVTPSIIVRTGSSTLQYAANCNADAPANYAACVAKGMFTLSGSVTLTMVVATRTASGAATAMVNGSSYTIVAAGTTDFTLVGSANNTPGTTFTKSGSAATGTGTVSDNTNPARLKAGSFMKFTKIA